jgi:hypothetical protein
MMSVLRDSNLEVLPDSEVVLDRPMIEITEPLFFDKIMVNQQTINVIATKQPNELFHQSDPFLGCRVAKLWQQLVQQPESYTLIHNSQYQEIDIGCPKFPIGSILWSGDKVDDAARRRIKRYFYSLPWCFCTQDPFVVI